MKSKVFCKGLFCRKTDRKFKCSDCGLWLCKLCSITTMSNKKILCPNCYTKTFSPDWDKLNKEFDEMLQANKTTAILKKDKVVT